MHVSDTFSELLQNKQFIWDTFDWQEVEKLKLTNSDRMVTLIRNEQIFAMDGSSSDELLEPENAQIERTGNEIVVNQAKDFDGDDLTSALSDKNNDYKAHGKVGLNDEDVE